MANVEFNNAAAVEALARAQALLADMTPVYGEIGGYMIDATRQRFLRGEAPDGTRWPGKTAATLARYRRMGYGALTRPLIGPGRRLSREIHKTVSKQGLVMGSALIYARVMQEGAAEGEFGTNAKGRPIPWGKIPARVWLGVSQADEKAIVAIVEEHLDEALGGGTTRG